jgi:hypothetical protein
VAGTLFRFVLALPAVVTPTHSCGMLWGTATLRLVGARWCLKPLAEVEHTQLCDVQGTPSPRLLVEELGCKETLLGDAGQPLHRGCNEC